MPWCVVLSRRQFVACHPQIGVVSVAASGKSVSAKPPKGSGNQTEFWIRTGNATKQFHGDDMFEYHEQHWG
jgi:hypothetical protein